LLERAKGPAVHVVVLNLDCGNRFQIL
jgi:hypothetical protein